MHRLGDLADVLYNNGINTCYLMTHTSQVQLLAFFKSIARLWIAFVECAPPYEKRVLLYIGQQQGMPFDWMSVWWFPFLGVSCAFLRADGTIDMAFTDTDVAPTANMCI